MRKALGILLLGVALVSCSRDFVTGQFEEELKKDLEEIKNYLEANNLQYDQDSDTGIYWQITQKNPTGREPDVLNIVHLEWSLYTLTGESLYSVKSTDTSLFSYNGAAGIFPAFVRSLNALREGEKGVFYIPSPYAFGDAPPANFTKLNKWDPIRLDMEVIKMYSETEYIDFFIERNKLGTPEVTSQGVKIIRASQDRPQSSDLVKGDNVSIKYKGYFLDKAKTTFDQGQFNYIIGTNGVIVGFEDALLHMRVGEKITAIIPSEKAYGKNGSGTAIPANTPLAFDLEIISKNN